MSKKNKKEKNTISEMINERKDWGDFNPTERVVPDKKRYNRRKDKKEHEYRYRT